MDALTTTSSKPAAHCAGRSMPTAAYFVAACLALLVAPTGATQQTTKISPQTLRLIKQSQQSQQHPLHKIDPNIVKLVQPPKKPQSSAAPVVLKRADTRAAAQSTATQRFQLNRKLAAPTGFGIATDAHACAKRAGASPTGPGCSELVDGSKVAMLRWNWAPCGGGFCVQHADGFRIYRPGATIGTIRAYGSHAAVATRIADIGAKPIATTAGTQDVFGLTSFKAGDCFVVRAFTYASGKNPARESKDSKPFCLRTGMRIGSRKVELTPKYAKNVTGLERKKDKAIGCTNPFAIADEYDINNRFDKDPDNAIVPIDKGDTLPATLVVGSHQRLLLADNHKGYDCDHRLVTFHRAAVYFNLAGLPHQIFSAALSFAAQRSALRLGTPGSEAEGPLHTYPFSCAESVGYATDNWIDAWDQKIIDGRGFDVLPFYRKRVNGPIAVDVLATVFAWLQGTDPNYGFLLKPAVADETEHSENAVCMTAYDQFKLTVVVVRTL